MTSQLGVAGPTLAARDRWSWLGIWIVGVTAAAWSFTALSELARSVGITAAIETPWVTIRIAWGLPLTIDVLAVIATRVWLRGEAVPEAIRYARRSAWVAIGASVAGNAYHGWLSGDGRVDGVIVSAVPAVAIGALVHLAVLVARPTSLVTEAPEAITETTIEPAAEPAVEPTRAPSVSLIKVTAPAAATPEPVAEPTPLRARDDEPLLAAVREWMGVNQTTELPSIRMIRTITRSRHDRARRLRETLEAEYAATGTGDR